MRTFSKLSILLGFLSAVIALAGCGGPSYTRHHFVLDASRNAAPPQSRKDIALEVRRFTIDSAFASKSLVYRKSEYEYEPDFYNEFLVSPAEMITEKTRNWLAESGLFEQVPGPGGLTKPTHLLEGDIAALYGDFTERKTPKAVVEMKIALLKKDGRRASMIFTKSYRASVQTESRNAEALVDAFDECLVQILRNLETDLTEKL